VIWVIEHRWPGGAASILLAGLSGVLLVIIFPAAGVAVLAPVALVPLLTALAAEPRPRRRFLLGWVSGCLFWAGSCYWIYEVLRVHGRMPAAGAGVLFAGFFLVKGLHLGVFAWLAAPLLRRSWAIPAVAALWVAVEGTHPYLGFTWLVLGNAATSMAAVARLAPITGVAGLSFALAAMNVAVTLALLRRPKTHLAWIAALLLLFLLPGLPGPAPGAHAANLVQTRLLDEEIQAAPWTPARTAKLLEEMGALSTAGSPELIVWPENPAPLYFYHDPLFRTHVETIARRARAHLLVGTVAYRDEAGRQPLNSAVLVAPDGTEVARYDKIHLVPFGEFVLWPFGSLVEKITREAGDFVPGDRVVVMRAGERKLGTFICYESAFGRAVRKFAADGAELLVNVSNDGWFGRSAARDQHLLIARLRAMENGRWLLRATNTGLTAVIDPAGRVTAALPPDRPGVLAARFDYSERRTAYTRAGDWFWWLTLAAAGAAKIGERISP